MDNREIGRAFEHLTDCVRHLHHAVLTDSPDVRFLEEQLETAWKKVQQERGTTAG